MKTSNRASHSNVKIATALRAMQERYSFTEFKKWDSKGLTAEFKIGAAFPMVLQQLGATENIYGQVKLTERILTLRPSTVRKRINEYVNTITRSNRAKVKAPKQIEVKATPVKTEGTLEEFVIALKAKIKQEVMSEILASLK